MSDSVNPSDVKNSIGQDNILLLPKEKRYIMVTDEESGKIKGLFPLKFKNLGTGWIALYQDMIFKYQLDKENTIIKAIENRFFLIVISIILLIVLSFMWQRYEKSGEIPNKNEQNTNYN